MFKRTKILGAIAGLLLALNLSTGTARAQSTTEMIFCNNTGANVYVAMAYWHFQYGDWYMYAWQKQWPGECKSIGSVGSGWVYYYAEKEGRRFRWPADGWIDRKYCVPDHGVNRPMYSGACWSGERLVGFHGIQVSGSNWTVNLND